MSRPIQHNAPAGQKYSSIRDAGEQTLATYCQRFPQSPDRESFILPILFKSVHPENVDQSNQNLSEPDKRLSAGLNINIRGERGEYEVYKVFYTLVRQSPTESILVLHGYRLDNDNGRNLKTHAIINELPTIDLSGVNMRKEHDFVVVVRYVGIVLCEVKTSASTENIASAESQLRNSEIFVQEVLTALTGPTSPQLPVVKVIIVPHELSTPSAPRKHNDCQIIYQCDLQNFATKWTQIVNELKIRAQTSIIFPNCFENFVQYLVGVWLMKPTTKKTYHFDTDYGSLATNVATIDSSVNRAEFAPTKQAQKLTTDIAISMNEIFRRGDELNIMYLSPQQKSLYDNYKHVLIHSHAGAGKTMLIIFKIMELLEADPTQKVLLVAPKPHHIRLQQILNKHNIITDFVKKFPYIKQKRTSKLKPPTALPTCDVLLITLQDFFEVPRRTLMKYDVSMFNVFVDDMHAYEISDGHRFNEICTFTDVGDFVDKTYSLLNTTNQYAWFGFDLVQQRQYYGVEARSDRLFMTNNGNPRTLSIPTVTMTNVLRCTKEITNVIEEARQQQMKVNELDTNHVIKDIACNHHITTGTRVLYEKLQEGIDRKHRIPFVCDRVCSLLRNLTTTTSQQPNNFPYSTVAILFNGYKNLKKYKPSLQSMIRQQFNVGVQSIEEQLLSNNNDDVIIDHNGNVQSFESPTVVYVRAYGGYGDRVRYNVLSRARTQCMVVDVDIYNPPLELQHIDVVMWKEINGAFQKM